MNKFFREKTETLPFLFGEGKRPAKTQTIGAVKTQLQTKGIPFDGYTLRDDGAILAFPSLEDMVIKEQPVGEGSTSTVIYLLCRRFIDGKDCGLYFFNLNSLSKVDIHLTPVFPEWAALDFYSRATRLAGRAITAGQAHTIEVPKAFVDGRPLKQTVPDGFGGTKEEFVVKQQTVYEPQFVEEPADEPAEG